MKKKNRINKNSNTSRSKTWNKPEIKKKKNSNKFLNVIKFFHILKKPFCLLQF